MPPPRIRLPGVNAADTIFALASGAGRAAVAVLRLSGPRAGVVLAGSSSVSVVAVARGDRRPVRTVTAALVESAVIPAF